MADAERTLGARASRPLLVKPFRSFASASKAILVSRHLGRRSGRDARAPRIFSNLLMVRIPPGTRAKPIEAMNFKPLTFSNLGQNPEKRSHCDEGLLNQAVTTISRPFFRKLVPKRGSLYCQFDEDVAGEATKPNKPNGHNMFDYQWLMRKSGQTNPSRVFAVQSVSHGDFRPVLGEIWINTFSLSGIQERPYREGHLWRDSDALSWVATADRAGLR